MRSVVTRNITVTLELSETEAQALESGMEDLLERVSKPSHSMSPNSIKTVRNFQTELANAMADNDIARVKISK